MTEGKEVYKSEEKQARYAIVKVQEKCPAGWCLEPSFCCEKCEECKIADNYGDSKEQLIKKIAQVLLREELEWYRENLDIIPKGKIDEPLVRNLYEHCLDKAKKIVEFLGVK